MGQRGLGRFRLGVVGELQHRDPVEGDQGQRARNRPGPYGDEQQHGSAEF